MTLDRAVAMIAAHLGVVDEEQINTKAPGTKILAFTRYKMGDGLEKKVSDLAAEVAEQTKMKG